MDKQNRKVCLLILYGLMVLRPHDSLYSGRFCHDHIVRFAVLTDHTQLIVRGILLMFGGNAQVHCCPGGKRPSREHRERLLHSYATNVLRNRKSNVLLGTARDSI